MIFDQLVTELHFSPFRELDWPPPEWQSFPTACPICGVIDASRFDVKQYPEPICIQCWQCNRHIAPEEWHCAECGKFLHSMDRYFRYRPRPGVNGEYLCGDHYAKREGLT